MLCSNCQSEIEKEEWCECSKCNQAVCTYCSELMGDDSAGVRRLFIVDQIWYKWLSSTYLDKVICEDCRIEIDKEFLMSLSPEELPLFINEEWITGECLELYKKLLGEIK